MNINIDFRIDPYRFWIYYGSVFGFTNVLKAIWHSGTILEWLKNKLALFWETQLKSRPIA